jgi:CheY-like chemotaxis protein
MGKKILLADDSITIQKVIELTFSDEDFDVVTVGNGRLAIERAQEIHPDVVLCDIIMPEKDGYEVCDFIKKNPALALTPVLLLTGAFEPFDQERAARVGCDGFIAKPFEPQTLIAKVKDLLSQASSRQAARPAPAPPAPAPPPPPAAAAAPPPVPHVAPTPAPVEEEPAFAAFEPEPEVVHGFADVEDIAEAAPPPITDFFETSPQAEPEDLVAITPEETADLHSPVSEDPSTLMFTPQTAPQWMPTIEVPLETRARASVESQTRAPEAPLFEEVFEEEPALSPEVEPPPPEPVVAAAPPPPLDSPVEALPPPVPVLVEPSPLLAPEPVVDESFASVLTPEPAPPEPSPSQAAEVAVPVEQVEQIAQRVVAQISEKVVREVAWEVIPDLAEALIKKEIERLKAELQQT